MNRVGILCVALILTGTPLLADPPSGEDLIYDLYLPGGQRVAYAIDFEVRHPGRLELRGEWSPGRVLSLRLEELGTSEAPLRRSGPSPQILALDVENPGDTPRQYKLHIRGLAIRDSATGTLVVRIPQPPLPPAPLLETLPPATPPPVPEFELPEGSPDSWRLFSQATDRFGDAVARDPRGDSCRWQTGMAGFLAHRRDALVSGDLPPSADTLATIQSIVGIVRRVEGLRTSTDPTLVGPAPEPPGRREMWSRIRDRHIALVESELDSLLAALERGHAPELGREPWAYRLVSCVIGCERHFEESVRLGEKRAVNLDLARAQWDRLLEAADVLESLTLLHETSGKPE